MARWREWWVRTLAAMACTVLLCSGLWGSATAEPCSLFQWGGQLAVPLNGECSSFPAGTQMSVSVLPILIDNWFAPATDDIVVAVYCPADIGGGKVWQQFTANGGPNGINGTRASILGTIPATTFVRGAVFPPVDDPQHPPTTYNFQAPCANAIVAAHFKCAPQWINGYAWPWTGDDDETVTCPADGSVGYDVTDYETVYLTQDVVAACFQ